MGDLWWRQLSRSKCQTALPGTKPVACQPREPAPASGENPDMYELAQVAGPMALSRDSAVLVVDT